MIKLSKAKRISDHRTEDHEIFLCRFWKDSSLLPTHVGAVDTPQSEDFSHVCSGTGAYKGTCSPGSRLTSQSRADSRRLLVVYLKSIPVCFEPQVSSLVGHPLGNQQLLTKLH